MSAAWPVAALSLLALGPGSSEEPFDPWTDVARYEIEYRADLSKLPADTQGTLRVWLPTPSESRAQVVLSKEIEAPWPYRETRDRYGNRAVYLERKPGDPRGDQLVMRFVLVRSPSNGIKLVDLRSNPADAPELYLEANKLIPLNGVIGELAAKESEGLETEGEKVRAFYDYIVRTMRYDKHGTGWGQGNAVWACGSKRGNCTDFHSLFIGMARSQNIPARFIMGFPIPPNAREGEVAGYHCWTQAYKKARGWLPLDASEAKKTGRVDDYFGKLPSDRIEFTLGRDLVLEPPQAGEPLNYWIYPYAELDGQPTAQIPWTLHFRRLPLESVRN